jgi:hypothetical protein
MEKAREAVKHLVVQKKGKVDVNQSYYSVCCMHVIAEKIDFKGVILGACTIDRLVQLAFGTYTSMRIGQSLANYWRLWFLISENILPPVVRNMPGRPKFMTEQDSPIT